MTAQEKAEELVQALERFLNWRDYRGDDWPRVWLTQKIAEHLKDDSVQAVMTQEGGR